jgi:Cellulose biosynthesis protein BcsS
MRSGLRTASIVVAAAMSFAAHDALADVSDPDEDQDTHILAAYARPPDPAVQDTTHQDQARVLLFATSDLWHQGGFSYGGALWAPNGLDREGPVFKLMFGGGLYHYNSGALGNIDVAGREFAASILPGWRFVRDNFYVTVFLGYDFQNHRLTPDDPSAGLRGSYNGVRTGFEVWWQPTVSTMVAADASVSTIGPGYNVRLATGLRVFDSFYTGPEVQAFGADDNYRQFRAGIHITGFRTGPVEWSAGAGWATDSDSNSGAYGKLGVWTRL